MFRELIFLCGAIVLLSVGLARCNATHETVIVEDLAVDVIYWHEHKRFTFVNNVGGEIVYSRLPFNRNITVNTHPTKRGYSCTLNLDMIGDKNSDSSCNVFIGSLDQVKTADWNHGKFGSGTTTRIE